MFPLRASRRHLSRRQAKLINVRILTIFCVAIFWSITFVGAAIAQTVQTEKPPTESPFNFASLTEPACPVTNGFSPAPITNEIRVLYYPMGRPAAIKDPKSLVLHLVLGHEFMPFDQQTISFTRREDGVWVTKVTYKNFRAPRYAIYWVEESRSKQVDANAGEYFEVPFCDLHGRLAEESVSLQAQSYTGILEAEGIERPTNYAKAVEILEDYIHAPSRGRNLIADLWEYKLRLRGDTPENRALLVAEINKFVSDHAADGFGLLSALNFVGGHSWVPADTAENLVQELEHQNPQSDAREFLLEIRASNEPDRDKRAALLREVIKEFPNGHAAMEARMWLFAEARDLGEREKLYSEIGAKNPNDISTLVQMAGAYLEANQKLPEALVLLDRADHQLDLNSKDEQATLRYGEEGIKFWKGRIAITRGDILIRQGKPAEALAILQPRKNDFKLGWSFYVYGRALEATGDKRGAVDAYLQSVVRVSQYQEDANTRLEKLWLKKKLGTKNELRQRVDVLSAQSFADKNYRPQVLRYTAPEFELTTLNGEKFSSSRLRGKKVILNFWAVWCGPCRAELKELEQFQQNHPEVVVLTAVDTTAESKDLRDLIREQRLASLRIAPTPPGLMEKFGAYGYPNTFIIDENGFVRIEQLGGGTGISRYLMAGLDAIRDAGGPGPAQTERP
jgi:thiol-disulfide isomerase/thioredoxin/predicted negative regulator of RcsB-dependent stress response